MVFIEKTFMIKAIYVLSLGMLASCAHQGDVPIAAPASCSAAPLVQINYDGDVVGGNKAELINAVSSGKAIYLGWALDVNNDGKDDVEHWHDAGFLTLFEGEVFTQTPAIEAQAPEKDPVRIELGPSRTIWRGVIGTNGTIVSRFGENGKPGTMRTRSTWCLK